MMDSTAPTSRYLPQQMSRYDTSETSSATCYAGGMYSSAVVWRPLAHLSTHSPTSGLFIELTVVSPALRPSGSARELSNGENGGSCTTVLYVAELSPSRARESTSTLTSTSTSNSTSLLAAECSAPSSLVVTSPLSASHVPYENSSPPALHHHTSYTISALVAASSSTSLVLCHIHVLVYSLLSLPRPHRRWLSIFNLWSPPHPPSFCVFRPRSYSCAPDAAAADT